MANTALTRTPGSAGNRRTWTWSAWIKKSKIAHSSAGTLFGAKDGSYPEILYFASDDTLVWQHDISGSDYLVTVTDRKFRDVSGWLHIVLAKDTTQSTEADRIKIYINGEQQTLTESQLGIPGQNYEGAINNNVTHTIGNWESNSYYFDGSMSHVHFIDGTAYAASTFGSTDSTTGQWEINTTPSVTYGTNGFFILKDGNSVTDQSGNSNNFTVASGNLTKVEDAPSNVFATLNPLNVPTSNAPTFSNGNTKTITMNVDPGYFGGTSTLGASSGKYYAEFKVTDNNGVGALGITFNPAEKARQGTTFSAQISDSFIYANNAKQYSTATGTSGSSYGNTYTDNDIIGVAMDLDNSKLYFHKNGTYQNSGVPTSGSTGTGAISITAGETYFFYLTDVGGSTATYECNFGNGYFGTTQISSAGTNASNFGIFEYDVPSGYTALCTKGINSF